MRKGVGFIYCHGLDVSDRENGEVFFFEVVNIMYLNTFACERNSLVVYFLWYMVRMQLCCVFGQGNPLVMTLPCQHLYPWLTFCTWYLRPSGMRSEDIHTELRLLLEYR